MEPLISIIVPIYNVEKYLPKCLESILSQTYRNLEIILVNDGSRDGCGPICDGYGARDSRIRVIHQENKGVSAARNAGLDIMQGRYVMFVDPDDWLSSDAVQVLYERLIRDGSDMAIGKHTAVYDDGSENDAFCSWMEDGIFTGDQLLASLGDTRRFAVVVWSKLYRRELFAQIRYPSITAGEDCWVYPEILERCGRVSSVNHLTYFQYQRQSSVMHVYSVSAQRDNLKANLRMTQYLLGRGFQKAAIRWYGNSIENAFRCQDKVSRMELMAQYLTEDEQKKLGKAQPLKNKIRWLALHHPALEAAIVFVKRTQRRAKL